MSGPLRTRRSRSTSSHPYKRPAGPTRSTSSGLLSGLLSVATSWVPGFRKQNQQTIEEDPAEEQEEQDVESQQEQRDSASDEVQILDTPPPSLKPSNQQQESFVASTASARHRPVFTLPEQQEQPMEGLQSASPSSPERPASVTLESLLNDPKFSPAERHMFQLAFENEHQIRSQSGFRFASSTPTGSRAASPSPTKIARRPAGVLSRNPNGGLRYHGTGSSRVRVRYSSPSFASSNRPSTSYMSTPSNPNEGLGSAKRRRTDALNSSSASGSSFSANSASAGFSTPPPSASRNRESAPGPSPNRVDAANRSTLSSTSTSPSKQQDPVFKFTYPRQNQTPASNKRLPAPPLFSVSRDGVPQTRPKQPSPLRQMFVVPSSPSTSSQSDASPSANRKTETAKLVQDLISSYDTESSSSKAREEIRNPYQDAVPAGNKRKRVKAPPPKRKQGAAAEKSTEEPPSGLKTRSSASTQKLVEASVPKGATRAKPPSLAVPAEPEENGRRRSPRLSPTSPTSPTQTFSALGAPAESGPTKKAGPTRGKGKGKTKQPDVHAIDFADGGEEVEEVDQLADDYEEEEEQGGSPAKKTKLSNGLGIGLGKPSAFGGSFGAVKPAEGPVVDKKEEKKADAPGSIFGSGAPSLSTSIFGGGAPSSSSSLFGSTPSTGQTTPSIFGAPSATSGLFGAKPAFPSAAVTLPEKEDDDLGEDKEKKDSTAAPSTFTPPKTSAFSFGSPAPSTTSTTPSTSSPTFGSPSGTTTSTSSFTFGSPSNDKSAPTAAAKPAAFSFSSPSSAPKLPPAMAASQPREPSKLRHSFAFPSSSSSSEEELKKAGDDVPRSAFAFASAPAPSSSSASGVDIEEIKKLVNALPQSKLPQFAFYKPVKPVNGVVESEDTKKIKEMVERLPKEELVKEFGSKFGFEVPVNGAKKASGSSEATTATTVAPAAAASSTTTTGGGFNWAAAGMKLPSGGAASGGKWTCSLCNCVTPDDKDKCSVCETPRPSSSTSSSQSKPSAPAPAPAPSAGGGGFNWAAAGMAKPAEKGGEWTCSLCMCKNADEGKTKNKCGVCESDR